LRAEHEICLASCEATSAIKPNDMLIRARSSLARRQAREAATKEASKVGLDCVRRSLRRALFFLHRGTATVALSQCRPAGSAE